MNPIQAVSLGFRGYVDFKGRSSRSEFWWWVLFAMIVSTAAQIMDYSLVHHFYGPQYVGISYILASLGLFLPYLAVSVRRLHDRGRSGFWLFIVLVPIIGVILLIVWYAMRGNEGTNNYGPHPSTKLDDGTPSVSGEARRFCSNCGVVLRDGASFCPSCGVQMSSVAEEQPGPGSFDAGSTVIRPRRPIWRRWKVIIGVPVGILALLLVLALVFGESSSSDGSDPAQSGDSSSGGGSDTRCENARDRLYAVGRSLSEKVEIDNNLFVERRYVGSVLRKELKAEEQEATSSVKRYCE